MIRVSMPGQSAQGRVPVKVPANPLVSNGTSAAVVAGADSTATGAVAAGAAGSAGAAGATGSAGACGLHAATASVATTASSSNFRFIGAFLWDEGRRMRIRGEGAASVNLRCSKRARNDNAQRQSASLAEDPAEHATQDLAADLVADGAGGLLGHGFDHALASPGTEHGVLHRLAETAVLGVVLLAGAGSGRIGRGRGRLGLLCQHFRRGFAIDGLVVLRADRAAGPYLRAFGVGDGAHAATRRGDQCAFDRHRDALVLQRRHQRFAGAELRD